VGALVRWRDEVGDGHALGPARAAVGVLLLAGAVRALAELGNGYFGDIFHWPMVPESWVPSRGVYVAIVVAQLALAALVTTGRGARPALAASALAAMYVTLCDRVQFHNNRVALAYYALLLSLTPCDRAFRLGRPAAATRGPLWAARLAGAQVSIIYLASGGSKLLDPDWREGRVIFERFVLFGHQAVNLGVPAGLVAWFTQPAVGQGLAALAIATELFLAVGLWLPATRVFALFWGVWFHLTIEATSRVEGFTWLTLAMYAVFVTPDVRARSLEFDPSIAGARVAAHTVRLLDWLARFDVRPIARGGGGTGAPALVVVRRDGTRVAGRAALAEIARCVPALFPLWLPLRIVAGRSA
jgi:hypothetical protein